MGNVPRMSANLGVGRESLLALIGALALYRGGDVAERFVKEKVIPQINTKPDAKSQS